LRAVCRECVAAGNHCGLICGGLEDGPWHFTDREMNGFATSGVGVGASEKMDEMGERAAAKFLDKYIERGELLEVTVEFMRTAILVSRFV